MSVSSTSSSATSTGSSSFSFDGITSGLKTGDIIDKLMTLEKGSLNQLTAQQTTVTNRDNAYQLIDTSVTNLQTALHKLLIPSNVNAKAVASSTSTVASAVASSDATNGNYSLNVTRLATVTTANSAIFDSGQNKYVTAPIGGGLNPTAALKSGGFSTTPTSGTFTINGTQITIDATNNTLNDVVSTINASSAGVTASITNDANGRPNLITLHSNDGTQPIMLGSGSDTSNFLSAAKLVSSGAAGDLTSSIPLGTVNTSAQLSTVNFGTALTASSGSFNVNGKQISWNAASDTLSTILGKINSSGAGVSAVYDPTTDSVSMVNTSTGSQSIDLDPAHDTGGLLGALHLTGGAAQQKLGQTAQFTINDGPTQYSNSNKLSGLMPGVSITLAGTGSTTLTVSQDTTTTISNVQGFVDAFNSLTDLIDTSTAYDSTNKSAAVLTGDAGIQSLEAQLRRMVTGAAPGVSGQYTSLASLGISTGAFGATVGTTSHLTIDSTKLTSALSADPSAVLRVLIGDPSVTTNANASGNSTPGNWVSSTSGKPSDPTHGRYQVTVDSLGNVSAVFTPIGGSAQTAVTGTISANGSNSTLIPGLTLNVGALPSSGTATDRLTFGQNGILSSLNDYLTTQLGKGGVFESEHTAAATDLKNLGSQITNANDLLTQKQATLQAQFTAMEVALAQLQSQGGQFAASMGTSSSSSSSSSSS